MSNILPSQPTPEFLKFVAGNVRRRRLERGLSQKALAALSGVSLRMIGGIEAGTTSASTATLDRVGIALKATLVDLVSDPDALQTATPSRLGWIGEHGGEGILLTSLPARREVETWAWRLEPGDCYRAGADPEGWRVMLFVVEGVLTLELADGARDLGLGAHLIDNTGDHGFANNTSRPLRFFRCTIW